MRGFSGLRPEKPRLEKFPALGGGVRGGGFRRQTQGEMCHKNIRLTFVKLYCSPDSCNLFDARSLGALDNSLRPQATATSRKLIAVTIFFI